MMDHSHSWEEYVELGRAAREHGDASRWELGDLANEIDAKYGEGAIEAWGKEIMLRRSTAYEYKRVAAFFPHPERQYFIAQNPMVTYSHFRMATKLGDLNYAYPFLGDCSSGGWTVEQAERELVGQPGQKGWRYKTVYKGLARFESSDDDIAKVWISIDAPELMVLTPDSELEVTVKVKEVVKAEERISE